jgi:hypothetical protein
MDFLAKNKVTTLEHPSILLTWLDLNLTAASTEISNEGTALL